MFKKIIVSLAVAAAVLMAACNTASVSSDHTSVTASVATTESTTEETAKETVNDTETSSASSEISAEISAETSTEASNETTKESVPGDGKYDRTYLVEEGGIYTYRLTDPAIIEKYDELFADAFADTIDYNEYIMNMMHGMRYVPDYGANGEANTLVYRKPEKEEFITTGSAYIQEYGFDLANIGYTYVDLDSDGTFELIMGVMHDDDYTVQYDSPRIDYIFREYALVDGKVVKIGEGGNRWCHWLGSDGVIYEVSSGGAGDWGISKLHFRVSKVAGEEDVDWGFLGFEEYEFVGAVNCVSVHFNGSNNELYEETEIPEDAIIEYEEVTALMDEWEARQIYIDWIKMSDYMREHSFSKNLF